jgi:hypothetical protein
MRMHSTAWHIAGQTSSRRVERSLASLGDGRVIRLRSRRSSRDALQNGRPLANSAPGALGHVGQPWGFRLHLELLDADGDVTQRWTLEPKV